MIYTCQHNFKSELCLTEESLEMSRALVNNNKLTIGKVTLSKTFHLSNGCLKQKLQPEKTGINDLSLVIVILKQFKTECNKH